MARRITGFRTGDSATVVDLWCRSLPADPITAARFRAVVLLDANFDPEGLRLCWQDDRLVGVAYAVRRQVAMVGDDLEPERGWVPFFFVAPEARGGGVGEAVLGDALEFLRKRGRTEVLFASYTPNYVLPGLDRSAYPAAARLLVKLGFTTITQAAAMDRSLLGYATPGEVTARLTALEGEGYTFGAPTWDELVPLIRLAHEDFNPDWARVIRESVLAGLGLDRIIVAREPSGVIVGWAMCGAYEGVLERFGPFGVLADHRGRGLGEVLLHLSMTRMRALGAHGAWFLWTGEHTPAGRLYHKTGFTSTRFFDVMRANL